jgi:hypothetical protein
MAVLGRERLGELFGGGTWRAASVQDRIVEWAEATPMSDKVKEQWAKVPFNVSHNIWGVMLCSATAQPLA